MTDSLCRKRKLADSFIPCVQLISRQTLLIQNFNFVKDNTSGVITKLLKAAEPKFRFSHFQEFCVTSIIYLLQSEGCAKVCFTYVLVKYNIPYLWKANRYTYS